MLLTLPIANRHTFGVPSNPHLCALVQEAEDHRWPSCGVSPHLPWSKELSVEPSPLCDAPLLRGSRFAPDPGRLQMPCDAPHPAQTPVLPCLGDVKPRHPSLTATHQSCRRGLTSFDELMGSTSTRVPSDWWFYYVQ